ncbi:carboxymuconolactone decarboxylase family protein [Rhodobacteraceae bacterium NNCM2]|nr:carboxymuconolactone decarboxylase family protein [Coraliihabitans acroporae]
MATARMLTDDELTPEAAAIFDDIRKTRNTDYVNNVWRMVANDPPLLASMWSQMKRVMVEERDGGLDPITKECIYLAVSIANNCEYCIHTHTAAARRKGLTDTQYGEFLDIVALASFGNSVATGMQVPVDDVFKVETD